MAACQRRVCVPMLFSFRYWHRCRMFCVPCGARTHVQAQGPSDSLQETLSLQENLSFHFSLTIFLNCFVYCDKSFNEMGASFNCVAPMRDCSFSFSLNLRGVPLIGQNCGHQNAAPWIQWKWTRLRNACRLPSQPQAARHSARNVVLSTIVRFL